MPPSFTTSSMCLTSYRYLECVASIIVSCMPSMPKFGSRVKESWSSKRPYIFSGKKGANTSLSAVRLKEPTNAPSDSHRQIGEDGFDLKHSFQYLDEVRAVQP